MVYKHVDLVSGTEGLVLIDHCLMLTASNPEISSRMSD